MNANSVTRPSGRRLAFGETSRLAWALVIAAAAASSACAVRTFPPTIGGYATIYAGTVPPDIYAYPHVYFNGAYAYLVNDRWYYPSSGGWLVLRQEPPVLFQYRRQFVQQAPPAYGPGSIRPARPPQQYGFPPPAPPAQRVR
jgi:hypothetical protein